MFGGGFPGFFGGMGDDDDESSQQVDEEVDNETFYKILGVDKKADINAIKKAYKVGCVKGEYRHPDKGGDPEKFKLLNEAYSCLVDPEKRDVYDKYGAKGLKDDHQGGGGGFDIFDLLQGRGRQQKQGPVKAKAKMVPLKTTLEEVYKGKMFKIEHTRKRTCDGCDGKGGKEVKKCARCKGKGIVQKIIQQGFMQQIFQQHCEDCKGQGECCDPKDKCQKCKGQKIVDEKTELEVNVEPGVYHDFDYIQTGEGDEGPGIMGGDIYVRVQIEEHKVFKRKGADLFITKEITLLEALTGFSFVVPMPDGKKLAIATAPGDVISHEELKCVKGKGMPFFKDAFSHGNLYIHFKVLFPKRGDLKKEQQEALKKVLPGPSQPQRELKKGEPFEYLEDFHEGDLNSNPEGGQKREDDDDSEQHHEGGQRVQCAQQ